MHKFGVDEVEGTEGVLRNKIFVTDELPRPRVAPSLRLKFKRGDHHHRASPPPRNCGCTHATGIIMYISFHPLKIIATIIRLKSKETIH